MAKQFWACGMIKVRLLGSAKKSFCTDAIMLEQQSVQLGKLLDLIQQKKPDGLPDLDMDNMLVAVNGADSSSLDGPKTLVNSGDTVSIIPVIHGGTPSRRGHQILIISIPGRRHHTHEFLDSLRSRYRRAVIQAIHSKLVLGRSHVERILAISIESERRGMLLADRLETDILLRFAATTQISTAIDSAGIRPGRDFVIIALGTGPVLQKIRNELHDISGPDPVPGANAESVRKHFDISKKTLDTIDTEDPLEDILAEQAAVLS